MAKIIFKYIYIIIHKSSYKFIASLIPEPCNKILHVFRSEEYLDQHLHKFLFSLFNVCKGDGRTNIFYKKG